jgi:hypothetical protein
MKKSIDTPLSEMTLRRYEKPYNLKKRELVRKLCLSIGLLNPGDSRDVIVDVLYVLLEARQEGKKLSSEEIRDETIAFRKLEGLDETGTAASNVRRQIRRLKDVQVVEKMKNDYRITEFLPLKDIFADKIERFMLQSILERVKEYIDAADESFKEKNAKRD